MNADMNIDSHGLFLLGFAGYSGSGKTTLLEKVITQLKQHNIRIGLIKHSHHTIEPDTPGKDSYRLRHAGCSQTLLATKERHMLYFEYPETNPPEPELQQCIEQLDHSCLDMIIVEGFRDEKFPKLEIHRPSYGKPLLCEKDEHIIAIASDDFSPLNSTELTSLPQLDLNNTDQICQFILERYHQFSGSSL
ncbi:molybdopterin-guanine dinucleotide biosynthesis protein B [Vibrio sp. Of7-15]|uniref:molybdopterin-guanine dinucleotide biosynthesis protein B n=1 Tax=Vibrio sp. Of7-15 TaxID=2724879 RepID=UPI001EF376F2|nr:molybdopterin-guanine dinucleotide biosynthesis protein B [Vibrio sp. Of7-15]MCG7497790.1 molybdopterin-guanine dinucleotide biosynthesis protein B [Vibrio sp. Of7-15]